MRVLFGLNGATSPFSANFQRWRPTVPFARMNNTRFGHTNAVYAAIGSLSRQRKH